MSTSTHQTVRLSTGRHDSPADGVCVTELASMLAGEPFGDQPESVCPVLGEFLRTYNDAVDDERRADLCDVAAAIVGTRGDRRLQRLRLDLCTDMARRRLGRWALPGGPPSGTPARLAERLARRPARHPEALALIERLIALGRPETPPAAAVASEPDWVRDAVAAH